MGPRLARLSAPWIRAFLGARPRALLPFFAPTLLAIAMDLTLRARALAGYAPQGKAIYLSSWLISAAFWVLPLWVGARLLHRLGGAGRFRGAARAGLGLFFALWLLPFATLCYGGQALYYQVFHSYVGRDTVRLGVELRGTVRDWFVSWGSPLLFGGMLLAGLAIALGMLAIMRRAAPSVAGPVPILPVLTFLGALVCCWTDQVDSRFLQAATPDACFVHGVVHLVRAVTTGQGKVRQGVSLRTPAPLPPLERPSPRAPNVVLILTESVRADALCSDGPPACRSPFFDTVVPDRVALGKLTAQTPNTFSACMVLWTGLSPDVDFQSAHTAPVLWEVAHALGYRTAYVTSQNPEYEDFGAFVRRAGIDTLVTALDLGGLGQEQLGAPDENATAEMLRVIRASPAADPYFAVLHLSNTHAPYKTANDLLPNLPQSVDPLGNVTLFHNHYENSVRLQERTVASFLRELRAMPSWDDTAVVFLSDHGEQFREHGGLYHNHSLFDEETRIPGWIVAGTHVLDDTQRDALRTYAGVRTYTQDVHETVVDLLGGEALRALRARLPLANLVGGRSLLRARIASEDPIALLATSTAVWEPDDAWFGASYRETVLVGSVAAPWRCYDRARDPAERTPLPAAACGARLMAAATKAYPNVRMP
jgi:glucan phosphoethanolaminetransferase (alkaline phosphatase superfamily)